ncbi:MAG: hypothetical protein IT383_13745 [Deltaproteobacteria bacterium]|nr:hypothetical protein [Deltaproteobacteria bacterium]
MLELVTLLAIGLPMATVAFGVAAWRARGRRPPLIDVDNERVVSAHGGPSGPAVLMTKPPLAAVTLASGGGRIDGPPHWIGTAALPEVGRRSWFLLERASLLLSNSPGSVRVGGAFDEQLTLGGGDEDVLRGLFVQQPVQQAALALRADQAFIKVLLHEDGTLTAHFGIDNAGMDRAERLAVGVAELVGALRDAANAPPIPVAALRLDGKGAGAGSGSPVGIPLGDRRHER